MGGGRGGKEAIGRMEGPGREGSFHNVLTRQGGWRGWVEDFCSVLPQGNCTGGGARQGRFISLCTVQAGRLEGLGRRVLLRTVQSPL